MRTLLQSSFNNKARLTYHIEDKSLVQTINRNKISYNSYHNLTIDEQNLMLAEVEKRGLFNDSVRKIIKDKMHKLNISFNFLEVRGTHLWNSTLLCGNDKIKVL
ncbi:22839_t:CDS:2 [Gigaspora margarita]|uniref:22839_t:CDS:1 n=1 Tax=Gigaspora margarita TaxID=4874 RepID=A0ABN7UWP9_GIGMA|nr:22839_t:CDS:2 [Gigaspora margarita]